MEVSTFKGGLRGMRATEPLKKGEIAIRLPRSSALVIEPTTKGPAALPDPVWKKQPWFMKLAVRLMEERRAGDNSHYSGYTSCLPQHVDLPCFWPDKDIEALAYPFLIKSIKKQKEKWETLVDKLSKEASGYALDRTSFLSCLAYVRSRSFSGPYIGSKLADRIRLGSIVAVLAIGNVLFMGIDSIEQTLNAVLAVSTFNFLYEFFLSQRLKVYLLAPGVDFMNHSCHVTCDLSYDYFQDGYSVRLDRDYAKDEQVFISYGNRSNDELLQYFGFVETNNPYDFVLIDDGIRKLYRVFSDITEATIDPPPEEQQDIEVFREGFKPSVLDLVKRWISETGVNEKNVIPRVMVELCQRECSLLEVRGSMTDTDDRNQMIDKFRKEKISILAKCIKDIQSESSQWSI